MNLNKNWYKEAKKSTINTNQHLLKQINQQELTIIKLKAKLFEVRWVINLQNKTWYLLSFSYVGLFPFLTGDKCFKWAHLQNRRFCRHAYNLFCFISFFVNMILIRILFRMLQVYMVLISYKEYRLFLLTVGIRWCFWKDWMLKMATL